MPHPLFITECNPGQNTVGLMVLDLGGEIRDSSGKRLPDYFTIENRYEPYPFPRPAVNFGFGNDTIDAAFLKYWNDPTIQDFHFYMTIDMDWLSEYILFANRQGYFLPRRWDYMFWSKPDIWYVPYPGINYIPDGDPYYYDIPFGTSKRQITGVNFDVKVRFNVEIADEKHKFDLYLTDYVCDESDGNAKMIYWNEAVDGNLTKFGYCYTASTFNLIFQGVSCLPDQDYISYTVPSIGRPYFFCETCQVPGLLPTQWIRCDIMNGPQVMTRTVCNPDEYYLTPQSDYKDTSCVKIRSPCLEGQLEIPPTATSDRVCLQSEVACDICSLKYSDGNYQWSYCSYFIDNKCLKCDTYIYNTFSIEQYQSMCVDYINSLDITARPCNGQYEKAVQLIELVTDRIACLQYDVPSGYYYKQLLDNEWLLYKFDKKYASLDSSRGTLLDPRRIDPTSIFIDVFDTYDYTFYNPIMNVFFYRYYSQSYGYYYSNLKNYNGFPTNPFTGNCNIYDTSNYTDTNIECKTSSIIATVPLEILRTDISATIDENIINQLSLSDLSTYMKDSRLSSLLPGQVLNDNPLSYLIPQARPNLKRQPYFRSGVIYYSDSLNMLFHARSTDSRIYVYDGLNRWKGFVREFPTLVYSINPFNYRYFDSSFPPYLSINQLVAMDMDSSNNIYLSTSKVIYRFDYQGIINNEPTFTDNKVTYRTFQFIKDIRIINDEYIAVLDTNIIYILQLSDSQIYKQIVPTGCSCNGMDVYYKSVDLNYIAITCDYVEDTLRFSNGYVHFYSLFLTPGMKQDFIYLGLYTVPIKVRIAPDGVGMFVTFYPVTKTFNTMISFYSFVDKKQYDLIPTVQSSTEFATTIITAYSLTEDLVIRGDYVYVLNRQILGINSAYVQGYYFQRRLQQCTQCQPELNYQVSPCTETSDAVCSACTQCPNLYTAASPCVTSDRTCKACDICSGSNVVKRSSCTPTEDSVCSICADFNTFETPLGCQQCSTCASGYYYQSRCTAKNDSVCKPCSVCDVRQPIIAACSSDSNTLCNPCYCQDINQYSQEICDGTNTFCTDCKTCSADQVEIQECKGLRNRACGTINQCPFNHYSTKKGLRINSDINIFAGTSYQSGSVDGYTPLCKLGNISVIMFDSQLKKLVMIQRYFDRGNFMKIVNPDGYVSTIETNTVNYNIYPYGMPSMTLSHQSNDQIFDGSPYAVNRAINRSIYYDMIPNIISMIEFQPLLYLALSDMNTIFTVYHSSDAKTDTYMASCGVQMKTSDQYTAFSPFGTRYPVGLSEDNPNYPNPLTYNPTYAKQNYQYNIYYSYDCDPASHIIWDAAQISLVGRNLFILSRGSSVVYVMITFPQGQMTAQKNLEFPLQCKPDTMSIQSSDVSDYYENVFVMCSERNVDRYKQAIMYCSYANNNQFVQSCNNIFTNTQKFTDPVRQIFITNFGSTMLLLTGTKIKALWIQNRELYDMYGHRTIYESTKSPTISMNRWISSSSSNFVIHYDSTNNIEDLFIYNQEAYIVQKSELTPECIKCQECSKSDNKAIQTACNGDINTVCVDCPTCSDNQYTACDALDIGCRDCTICPDGFYSSNIFPCGKGSWRYSDTYCVPCITDCGPGNYMSSICNPYQNAVCTTCSVCDENQFLVTPCSEYQDTKCEDCVACDPGYYRTSDCQDTKNIQCSPCTAACPFGYRKVSECTQTSDIKCEIYNLTECPQNYTSITIGSFTAETCVVCADYAYQAAPGLCLGCDNGKYLDLTTRQCVDCPTNSYAPPYSNSIFQCQCIPGHIGYNGSQCVSCGVNFYKSGSQPGQCVPCPSGKISKIAADSINDCLCSNNTVTKNGICENCPIGTFADSSNLCQTCPLNYGYYTERGGCGCPANTFGYTNPIHVFGQGTCSSVLYRGYSTSFYLSGSDCVVWVNSFSSMRIKVITISGGAMNVKYGNDILSFIGSFDVYDIGYELTITNMLMYLNTGGNALVSAEIVCQPCPNASTSSPATTSVQNCQCQTGYSIVDGICQKDGCPAGKYLPNYYETTCVNCPVTTYKATTGTLYRECLPCPLNSFSLEGSGSFSSCQCNANYYKSGTSCLRCPENSVSNINSLSITDCKCKAGFTGSDGGTCTKCLSTQYKPTIGSSACTNCQANSIILDITNIDASQCLCLAGYYFNASTSTCVECPAMTMKLSIGNQPSCSQCPDNMVFPSNIDMSQTGAVNDPTSLCQCNAGYTGPNGGPCQRCPDVKLSIFTTASTYKSVPGPAECSFCPFLLTPSADRTQCVCIPGAYAVGDTCQGCPVGTYKGEAGNFSCSICDAGKYTAGVGSQFCSTCGYSNYQNLTGQSFCYECEASYNQKLYSTTRKDCLCGGGKYYKYADYGPICFDCPRNTFLKSETSLHNVTSCTDCPTGTFIDYDDPYVSKNLCRCKRGYSGVYTDCKACPEGKYKPYITSFLIKDCSLCPANSWSPVASSDITACTCVAGFTGQNGSICTRCPPNTYKSVMGSEACKSCPANSFSFEQTDTIDKCMCNRGYERIGDECKECQAGTYKTTYGNQPCTSCPFYSTSFNGSLSKSDCVCIPGYRATVLKNCLPCPMGSYKSKIGNYECDLCPDNTWSPMASTSLSDCQCLPGYTSYSGVCIQCGFGTYKTEIGTQACTNCPNNSLSQLGANKVEDCYCVAPYTQVNGTCQLCPANTYKNENGNQPCTACPQNSVSPIASRFITDCVCKDGYIKLSNSECALCPANTYRLDNYTCKSCPLFSTSPYASLNISSCKCNAGYVGFGGYRCVACPTGKYSNASASISSLTECTPCPSFSTSASGSLSISDCKCNPGYFQYDNIVCGLNTERPYDIKYSQIPYDKIVQARNIIQDASRQIKINGIVSNDALNSNLFDGDVLTSQQLTGSAIIEIQWTSTYFIRNVMVWNQVGTNTTIQCYLNGNIVWSQYLDLQQTKYTLQPFQYMDRLVVRSYGESRIYEIKAFEGCPEYCIPGMVRYVTAENILLGSKVHSDSSIDVTPLIDADLGTSMNLQGRVYFDFHRPLYIDSIDVYYSASNGLILLSVYNQSDFENNTQIIIDLNKPRSRIKLSIVADRVELGSAYPSLVQYVRAFTKDCDALCTSTQIEPYQDNLLLGSPVSSSDGESVREIVQIDTTRVVLSEYSTQYTLNNQHWIGSMLITTYLDKDQYSVTLSKQGITQWMLKENATQTLRPDILADAIIINCLSDICDHIIRNVRIYDKPIDLFSIYQATSTYTAYNSTEFQLPNYMVDQDDQTAIVLNTAPNLSPPISVLIRFDPMYVRYMIIDVESEVCSIAASKSGSKLMETFLISPPVDYVIYVDLTIDSINITTEYEIRINSISVYTSLPTIPIITGVTDVSMPYYATDNNGLTSFYLQTSFQSWSTVNLTLKKPTYMEQISMSLDWSYAYRSFYNVYLYFYNTLVNQYIFQTSKLFHGALNNNVTHMVVTMFAKDPSIDNLTANTNCYYDCIKTIQPTIECKNQYCMQCPSGKYKSNVLASTCSDCPANSDSPVASTNIRQCTCKSGHVGFPGQPCTACPSGKYAYNSYYCATCPSNTYSMVASSKVTQCGCKEGYYGKDGWSCIACDVGKYKPFSGQGDCIDCPANTLSEKGAANISSCYCPAGFYQDPTTFECNLCPAGTYNDAISQTFCKQCTPHSTSPQGSISIFSCVCQEGFIFIKDQFQCKACPSGRYKITSDTCAPCPINSISNNGSAFRTQCKCMKGYTGNDGDSCSPCDAGTYKDVVGSSACISCDMNQISNASAVSKSDCQCKKGYYTVGASCSICPEGKFQNTTGQSFCFNCKTNSTNYAQGSTSEMDCVCSPGFETYTDLCLACKNGQYQDPSDLRCKSCGAGFYTPLASVGIASCQCDLGFYYVSGGCKACPIGNYSNTRGATACKSCAVGSSTLITQATSYSDCICSAGYYNSTSFSCSACPSNTYKSLIGNYSCTSCDPNAISPVASNSPLDCKCKKGYNGIDGSLCTPCAANSFKFTEGIGTCYSCPVDSIAPEASVDISNCSCLPGYTDEITGYQSKTCKACPIGTYKPTYGGDACTSCQYNSYSPLASTNSSACYCNPGYYMDLSTGSCKACGVGNYNPYPGSTYCRSCTPNSITYRSTAVFDTECVCNTGYSGDGFQGCTACPGGFYKDTVGTASCAFCPTHSSSGLSSTDVSQCECNAGFAYTYDPFNDKYYCSFCVPGKYKNFTANSDCLDCPYGTTSELGGTVCICGAGYHVDYNQGCVACAAGKYSEDNSETCNDCPQNTTSPAGSDLLTRCVCIPGHTAPSTGMPCSPCEAGKYKPETSSSECTVCPENQYSYIGSSKVTDCYCNSGYYKSEPSLCEICPSGKYKSSGFETSCIDCPDMMISAEGSSSVSDCICPSGYVILNGICQACPINTYGDGVNCYPCPPNSISDSASSSINACQCKLGYYYIGIDSNSFQCQLCPKSTYKDNLGMYSNINIAQGSNAWVSTLVSPASLAIDGYTKDLTPNGLFACASTALEQSPWLRIDLGRPLDVSYIHVYSPEQSNIQLRVGNLTDVTRALICQNNISVPSTQMDCHIIGQYVFVYAPHGNAPLTVCEIEIFSSCKSCGKNAISPIGSTSLKQCSCDLGYLYNNTLDTSVSLIQDIYSVYYQDCLGNYVNIQPEWFMTNDTGIFLNEAIDKGSISVFIEFAESIDIFYIDLVAYGYQDSLTLEIHEFNIPLISMPWNLSMSRIDLNTSITTIKLTANEMMMIQYIALYKIDTYLSDAITYFDYTIHYSDCFGNTSTFTKQWLNQNSTAIALNDLGSTPVHIYIDLSRSMDIQYFEITAMSNNQHMDVKVINAEETIVTIPWDTTNMKRYDIDRTMTGLILIAAESIVLQSIYIETYNINGQFQSLSQYNEQMCVVCSTNQYLDSQLRSCQDCPEFSASPRYAVNINQCVCNPGYQPLFLDSKLSSCTPCPLSTYKPESGNIDCHACPSNSVTVQERALSQSECLCKAGYYGEAGNCKMCVPGRFKDFIGRGDCQLCPPDTYSDGFATNTSLGCKDCPDSSQSPAGSTGIGACVCNAGYQPNGESQCQGCTAGSYKNLPGDVQCDLCSKGTYSTTVASTTVSDCQECPIYSTTVGEGAGSVSYCLCNAGYYGIASSGCQACAQGTYKSTQGSAACTTCPTNSYSDSASQDLSDCKCNFGYSKNPYYTTDIKILNPLETFCLDLNECLAGLAACSYYSQCLNGVGNYSCACDPGWRTVIEPPLPNSIAPVYTCEDINECTLGLDDCDHATTTCTNVVGSFYCPCQTGFYSVYDPTVCIDINECQEAGNCVQSAICTNTPGSFTCNCNTGFEFDTDGVCVNINECNRINTCNDYSVCIDTIGSYLCICQDGFEKDPSTGQCQDINECTSYLNDCDINAYCNNTIGSFTCTCNEFWKGTGTYCESKFCDPCLSFQDCYYSGGNCPPNSYPIRNFTETEYSQCRCHEGYYWLNDPVTPKNCTLCPKGYYCTAEEIFQCPDNSMNYYGQNSIDSCICNEGYYRIEDTCVACPADYYCTGNNEFTKCPDNSSSLAYSTSIVDCHCLPSYYYVTTGICLLCPERHYCPGMYDGKIHCPANTYSVIGSSDLLSCQCEVGYSGVVGSADCTSCQAGTFKDTIGQVGCTDCPSLTYSPYIASPTIEQCLNCPNHSISDPASPSLYSCLCDLGYYQKDRTSSNLNCDSCKVGTYNDAIDQTVCKDCPIDTYQPYLSQISVSSCIPCPQHASSLYPASSSCVCDPGYITLTYSFQDCQGCSPGYYMDSYNLNSSCIICANNTYQPYPASSSCTHCPNNMLSPQGSTALTHCYCPPGTYFSVDRCISCPHGTYKYGYNRNLACDLCPPNTYNPKTGSYVISDCLGCPINSLSPSGSYSSEQCYCNVGTYVQSGSYSGFNYRCTNCTAGSYIDQLNQTLCKLCPLDTFSTYIGSPTINNCLKCPYKSQSLRGSNTITNCKCNTGYYGNDGTACTPCSPGTYKTIIGDSSCQVCPDNTYSNLSASTSITNCLACRENSLANPLFARQQLDCKCDSGYQLDALTCYACPAGTYQPYISNEARCIQCGENFWSAVIAARNSSVCTPCRSNSLSLPGSDNPLDCLCIEGYGFVSNQCQECHPGYYKSTLSNDLCSSCPEDTYNTIPLATSVDFCLDCTNHSVSKQASYLKSQCLCVAGYSAIIPIGERCDICNIGKYSPGLNYTSCINCNPGRYADGTGFTVCKNCPLGEYNTAPGLGYCSECEIGKYNDRLNSTYCVTCQDGKTTEYTRRPSIDWCINCHPGSYSFSGNPCQLCPTGTFNNISGISYCIDCANGTIAPDAGTLSCTPCQGRTYTDARHEICYQCDRGFYTNQYKNGCDHCDAGYILNETTIECLMCPADTYSQFYYCQECHPNMYTKAPTDSVFGCYCNAGYESDIYAYQDKYCFACNPGYYSDLNTSEICVSCPPGKFSAIYGATYCQDCLPGHYNPDHSQFQCLRCDINTYLPYYGAVSSQECIQCPPNSVSDQASTNATDCHCVTGHSGRLKVQDITTSLQFTNYTNEYYTYTFNQTLDGIGKTITRQALQSRPIPITTQLTVTSYDQQVYECIECNPGSYKDYIGNGICYYCSTGKYTNRYGTVLCDDCNTGYFNPIINQTVCLACLQGTYSDLLGQSTCQDCPIHTNTTGIARNSIYQCLCEEGYEGTVYSDCTACPPGDYKPTIANIPCSLCPINTYNPYEALTFPCFQCPSKSLSNEGSPDIYSCQCVPGYERLNSSYCNACQPGNFKNLLSNEETCNPCPYHKFQEGTNASICQDCRTHSITLIQGASKKEQCLCDVNYEPYNWETCKICPYYAYKNFPANVLCQRCPRTFSVAQQFFIDGPIGNQGCNYGCETGYLYDRVNQLCIPESMNLQPHNFDFHFISLSTDSYNGMSLAFTLDYFKQSAASIIPGSHPIQCQGSACCLMEMQCNAFLPSDLEYTFQTIDQVMADKEISSCEPFEEIYWKAHAEPSRAGYNFMNVTELSRSSTGEMETVTIKIDMKNQLLDQLYGNCTWITQDTRSCYIHLSTVFSRLSDSNKNSIDPSNLLLDYQTFDLPIRVIDTPNVRLYTNEHYKSDIISYASSHIYQLSGTFFAMRLSFYLKETISLKTSAFTLTLWKDSNISLSESHLCNHLIVNPPPCFYSILPPSPVFIHDCSSHVLLNSSHSQLWIPLDLTDYVTSYDPDNLIPYPMDTIQVHYLASTLDRTYSYMGNAYFKPSMAASWSQASCNLNSIGYAIHQDLNIRVKQGIIIDSNHSWDSSFYDYNNDYFHSQPITLTSNSLLESMILIEFNQPGVNRVEVMELHVMGDSLNQLVQDQIAINHDITKPFNPSYLELQDSLQDLCFDQYPLLCITEHTVYRDDFIVNSNLLHPTSKMMKVPLMNCLNDKNFIGWFFAQAWLDPSMPALRPYLESLCSLASADASKKTYYLLNLQYNWNQRFLKAIRDEHQKVFSYLRFNVKYVPKRYTD